MSNCGRWVPKKDFRKLYCRNDKKTINQFISATFSKNQSEYCLILDTPAGNTINSLREAGIESDKIIVVNDNRKVVEELNKNFSTVNLHGDVFKILDLWQDYLPPNIWLDLENNITKNQWKILQNCLKKYKYNDSPCWFITLPTRKNGGPHRTARESDKYVLSAFPRFSCNLRWVYGPSHMLLLQYSICKDNPTIVYRLKTNENRAYGFPKLKIKHNMCLKNQLNYNVNYK